MALSQRTVTSVFTATLLMTAALAGCLNATDDPAPQALQTRVARAYTVAFDPAAMESLGSDASPQEVLDQIFKAKLLVYGAIPGVYSLTYTDKAGQETTKEVTIVDVAKPVEVDNVDPLTGIVLKLAGAVQYERAPKTVDWWHAGPIPLGVVMTEGAKAEYVFRSANTAEVTVNDVAAEGGMTVKSATMSVNFPFEGTASWALGAAGADGAPLDIAGSFKVPEAAKDLFLVDVSLESNGQTGAAGVALQDLTAEMTSAATLYIQNGQPVAGEFKGGSATLDPRITGWMSGFIDNGGMSCSGKARADNCRLEEAYAQSPYSFPHTETIPAEPKEAFELPVAANMSDEEKEILDFVSRLFAQQIDVGDSLSFAAGASDETFASGASGDYEFGMAFTLQVASKEDVTVPAGTFPAFKLVSTLTTKAKANDIVEDGATLVDGLDIDETVARSTLWLHATHYTPLKMESEFPVDFNALIGEIVDSLGDEVWTQANIERPTKDKYDVKISGSFVYEATKLEGTSTFAPVVGLYLGSALSSLPMLAPMMAGTALGGLGATQYTSEPTACYVDRETGESYCDGPDGYPGYEDYSGDDASDYGGSEHEDYPYEEYPGDECYDPETGEYVCDY